MNQLLNRLALHFIVKDNIVKDNIVNEHIETSIDTLRSVFNKKKNENT